MMRKTLSASCLLLALIPLGMWANTADQRRDAIEWIGSRRAMLIWDGKGGGRVSFEWMMPDRYMPRHGPRFVSEPLWPDDANALSALFQLGPFGSDLGLPNPLMSGTIVVPFWFLSLLFLAYPALQRYRRWKARRVKGAKGAFEPVMA